MDREIVVRGAREHNLQDVDLRLPHGKLVCFTGVSGSGKSSLAFDTVYAEGQRRYLESLSSYARQFIGQLPKPDVDHLSGLSPSISISQKSTSHNPRSTVGTVTEIQDFLRVLYARVGTCFCSNCGSAVAAQTVDQIYAKLCDQYAGGEVLLLAPLVRMQKGQHLDLFEQLQKQSFVRARVDGELIELSNPPKLDKLKKHTVEVIVDRLSFPVRGEVKKVSRKKATAKAKPASQSDETTNSDPNRRQTYDSLNTAIRLGSGTILVTSTAGDAAAPDPAKTTAKRKSKRVAGQTQTGDQTFSTQFACATCGLSYEAPSPQLMSFNSPAGMCRQCHGLGVTYSYDLAALVANPKLSVRQGAISLLGLWTNLSKLNQTRLRITVEAYEKQFKLSKGYILRTAWKNLDQPHRDFLLQGGPVAMASIRPRGRAARVPLTSYFDGLLEEFAQTRQTTKNPLVQRQHEKLMTTTTCPSCDGDRLNPQACHVKLQSTANDLDWQSLPQVGNLPLAQTLEFFNDLQLDSIGWQIAGEAIKEIKSRLGFLLEVGLEYLSLNRTAPTLSGGESQRIRLASQIGSGLVGVTYVLDEPSIGLHPRDNDRLIRSLKRLRDLGNTLVVVEHDEDTMEQSDLVVDFGPGPGVRGGKLIGVGSSHDLANNTESLTGDYLSGRRIVGRPNKRREGNGKTIAVTGARHHNLKNIDVEIPLGKLVCVTGVSGSGKSSLISDILTPTLANALMKAEQKPGEHDSIVGLENLDKIIDIDQSPIGRTPRSNPATYVKVFDEIRSLFMLLPEAKRRGYLAGRFSFNTQGGRCSACEGNGATRLDMEMLADLWVPCPVCEGRRYDHETLEVKFKDKSIADVLEMDVQEALLHFSNVPKIAEKLQTLHDVGLDYIKLGQPSPTLSGGEAQRIKLAKELSRRATGRTLYVLDEPTTGLHFHDISMLLNVLQKLVDLGNTVVVVEHNLDLIQAADWVLDLGLEGGEGGGKMIAIGTPEDVAKVTSSYTGVALKNYLANQANKQTVAPKSKSKVKPKTKKIDAPPADPMREIIVRGAQMHNLKSVDVTLQRGEMTVFCGHSGSGKTSLAMDTIYAEGQRRYVESLSSYARQFVGQMPKPVVTSISGLSPAVALEQKNLGHTPRSTVGTVTEIYDYLRVFMARIADMRCPDDMAPVKTQTVDQIVSRIMEHPTGTRAMLLAPICDTSSFNEFLLDDIFFDRMQANGFSRIRINGKTSLIADREPLDPKKRHTIDVVVDRVELNAKDRSRIADSVEQALGLADGRVQLLIVDPTVDETKWQIETHSKYRACQQCGKSYQDLTPHHFSFNTQIGWCPNCNGLGVQVGTNLDLLMDPTKSLRQNGLSLWPNVDHAISAAMLDVMCQDLKINADEPIGAISASKKNLLLFGTGERWLSVTASKENPFAFQFQFRGVIPALELASRSSPALRMKLDSYVAQVECLTCSGSRVRPEAAVAIFREMTIVDLVNMSLGDLYETLRGWKLKAAEQKIAGELLNEIEKRLGFLIEVGLEYLTLGRSANTLSGGEAQRIRLAAQLGSGLCGVLYVLDEPTIGLHPRDNDRLIGALHRLRDYGNTLLVVEHDRDVIASSDSLCDFGPGSGHLGGEIVAAGSVKEVTKKSAGVTGPFLSGKQSILVPSNRRVVLQSDGSRLPELEWLTIRDAYANTLRHIDVAIPLGRMTAITGPSGSGKSSLINGILYPALARRLHRANMQAGPHGRIEGIRSINKVIRVDQSPLGSSPSSTAATYTGVFDDIRQAFASLQEARQSHKTSRDFSFNVFGGRCEKCEGNGQCRIEMHFLPDVWVECDACHGKRYNQDVLDIRYRGKNIYEVLSMSIVEAIELFEDEPRIYRVLKILDDVGLGYISLGQSAPTFSGGEAQRVKLAAEIARPATGKTLYLFDEPTTGLHFDDIAKLLHVFHRLVDNGNTVVVIEHNLDVIKCADWVIDLGPEAGWGGGQIVHAGTPESLAEYATINAGSPKKRSSGGKTKLKNSAKSLSDGKALQLISYTGIALAPILKSSQSVVREDTSNEISKPSVVASNPIAKSENQSNSALQQSINIMDDREFLDARDCVKETVETLADQEDLVLTRSRFELLCLHDRDDSDNWFAIMRVSDSLIEFSFRVSPEYGSHELPFMKIIDGARLTASQRKQLGHYHLTQIDEWLQVSFTMNDQIRIHAAEFRDWVYEAFDSFFTAQSDYSFIPD